MTRHSLSHCNSAQRLSLLTLGVSMLATPAVHAQAPTTPSSDASKTDPLPTFAVSTIKPNNAGADGMIRFMYTESGISDSGVTAHLLLREAFDVEDDRILGEPSWVKDTRYDIEAKVDNDDSPRLRTLTPAQRGQMLLPLLADRFDLKYHHETKILPIYALLVAKGGSKLQEPKPSTTGEDSEKHWMTSGNGKMDAIGVKLETLTSLLSQQLGHTVINKTNLTGAYTFKLKWTPDDAPQMAKGADGTPDDPAPSLFTALQEQLGLKLESQKSSIDVIVIDHIELPSAN